MRDERKSWGAPYGFCGLLFLGICVGSLSCRKAEPAKSADLPPVEEVSPPVDRGASFESDPTPSRFALPGGDRLSLPGGFPREVPWPEGGGIVDSGPCEGGAWVEWVVPQPRSRVQQRFIRQLEEVGFRHIEGNLFERDGQVLRVDFGTFEAEGTRVRVEPLERRRS
jgi:hypothetical protein